ncbi:hypothetical protein A0H81_13243 [Grifola frondosa]|uniref:Uncharacterized protein n=1 Tax=Grifola frondosa TaxID=5627 RepID=A0A1C7LQA9_GRIFR|nr:hypothetical protein A0H81_13243 [Grifola frondosa]
MSSHEFTKFRLLDRMSGLPHPEAIRMQTRSWKFEIDTNPPNMITHAHTLYGLNLPQYMNPARVTSNLLWVHTTLRDGVRHSNGYV